MTATPLQQSPYLREQRQFPDDNLKELSQQVDLSYIDIATKVNLRTIGLYAINFPIITGDQWFFAGQPRRQQSLRQAYTFADPTTTIPHGLKLGTITNFSRIWGTFQDVSGNWQVLPYVDVVSATNQIYISVNATNIVITKGAGSPPAINNGLIVLEWISQF